QRGACSPSPLASGGSGNPVGSPVVAATSGQRLLASGVTRMPFFRRLAPRQCLDIAVSPHLGFMSAQILHPMLRRVLIVAATVVPITLAAAGERRARMIASF